MKSKTRRRTVHKIVLSLILLLAGGALAAWYWIASTADRKWASMERRLAELTAEARAREGRRPPRPGLVPGDAWDDYLEALDLLEKDVWIEDAIPELWNPVLDAAKIEALLDRNPRVLELVRRGARRASARHPDLSDRDFYSPRIGTFPRLHPVLIIAERRLAREGKVREAADALLDLLQAGNDAARDAIHSTTRSADDFPKAAGRELVALPLSKAEFAEAAREVERLEADLVSCEADLRSEFLRRSPDFADPKLLSRLTAWQARRFGFSTRLMMVSAFERAEELWGSTTGVDSLSIAELEALAAEHRSRAAASGNVALQALCPNFLVRVYPQRARLARLRLLRAALHERAAGERLELADPFGTTLRWSAPGLPLRIWSVGLDGKDNGGKEPEDLVLTVP